MDETQTLVVVTVILIGLPLVWAAVGWFARRSVRPLLRGVGLALVALGLLLTGLLRLLVRAIGQVVVWFSGVDLTAVVWTGIVVAVVGLVMWLVAGAMTPISRDEARRRREAARAARRRGSDCAGKPGDEGRAPAAGPGSDSRRGVGTAPASRRSQAAPEDSTTMSDEDRELEELLRRRGIE